MVGGEPRVVASATGSATIGIYKPDGHPWPWNVEQAVPGSGFRWPTGRSERVRSISSNRYAREAHAGRHDPNIVGYGLGLPGILNLLPVGCEPALQPSDRGLRHGDRPFGPVLPGLAEDFQFLPRRSPT